MEIFLQTLRDSGVGPTVIGLVLFLIWLVNKLPAIDDYQKKRKIEKIESLDKAIVSSISESEKSLLNQEKAQQIFYEATGFNGHQKLREKIAKLIIDSNGQYNLQDFISIRSYLEYDKNRDTVIIDIKPSIWYSQTFMWCIFVGIILAIILLIIALILFFPFFIKMFTHNLVFLLSLIITPLVLLALYAPDARKYKILTKLYESQQALFLFRRPNKNLMFTTVIIYLGVFYESILWVKMIS